MSRSDDHSDAGASSSEAASAVSPHAPERYLAAPVDSGLAGLLAGILARAESESEADSQADPAADSDPEFRAEAQSAAEFEVRAETDRQSEHDKVAMDEAELKVQTDQRWFSVPRFDARAEFQPVEAAHDNEPVLNWNAVEAVPAPAAWDPPPTLSLRATAVAATQVNEVPPLSAPDWNTLPVPDAQPEIATWADADRVLDLDDGAVAPPAFRWSDESLSAAPSTTPAVEAAAKPRLVLTPVDLEPEEQDRLLEGLSRVQARAGEEGLPFAVVHLELSGAGLGPGTGEVTRRYVQSIVRDGDVVVRLGDRSVAMMCGGLFFPGDMEVVGERLRAQVYQACQVLFNVDHLTIVVAGALMAAGEDISKFLTRGASARFHATAHRRTDVLIDYVSHSLSR